MSRTWKLAIRALNEASGKDSLLSHVALHYGENEADALAPFLDSLWNPDGLEDLRKVLTTRYSDPKIEDILQKAMGKAGIKGAAISSEPATRGRGRPPGTGKKQQAAQQTTYVDPEQAAAQQAKTAATAGMRPDRAGTVANIPRREPVQLKPGERPQHDVGTAGQSPGSMPGHTRPVQAQPSQGVMPSTIGKDLVPLRAKEKELTTTISGLSADPKKNARQLQKVSAELGDIKQKIARLTQAGKSGIEDSQKRVDYISKTYPGTSMGDELAKKLGVPTTKQRTRKTIDPESGEEKITVQIWSADKVAKFSHQSSELPNLPHGVYDLPGKEKLPEPEEKGSYAEKQIRKPMMKVPKGLDQEGIKQLAALRSQFKMMKSSGADDEKLQPLKQQIDAIMASSGEVVDTVMPGSRPGVRWKPSGVSKQVATSRPDMATGQFVHGSRYTNPAEEGQEVVWNGNDWVLPSAWAAQKGKMAAAGSLPTGERRPWSSSAQNVGPEAKPVSTNAEREKMIAARAAAAKSDKGPSIFGKHKQVKQTVSKAFDDDDNG